MRILYIRTQFNFNLKAGGSVGHTSGVINSFRKNNDVDVVSNDNLYGVNGNVRIIKPVKTTIGLIRDIFELIYNFKVWNKLKKKCDYDFIYHRYTGNSFVAAKLAHKHEIPLVLEFNSSEKWKIKNWGIKQSFLKNLFRKIFNIIYKIPVTSYIENYNLKHATLIVVVSDVLKEGLIEEGVSADKILVNYNGVDPSIFNPSLKDNILINKYNLENKFIFGFIGTFGYWHGVKELALAIVKFFDKHPERIENTQFILIGNGILMNDVKQILSKLTNPQNVILTGTISQDQAPNYLSICNAFLSPHIPNKDGTRFFGSPTKLFEYMAMGKAIIASNIEQLGIVLQHKYNSFLIEPQNIESLVEAMKFICDNPEIIKQLGRNARKDVLEKYTWQVHTQKVINGLKTVLLTDKKSFN